MQLDVCMRHMASGQQPALGGEELVALVMATPDYPVHPTVSAVTKLIIHGVPMALASERKRYLLQVFCDAVL